MSDRNNGCDSKKSISDILHDLAKAFLIRDDKDREFSDKEDSEDYNLANTHGEKTVPTHPQEQGKKPLDQDTDL